MKKLKNILCLLLSLVTLLGLAACHDTPEATPSGEQIKTTNTYVVKNGVSPYKILIPEEVSVQLQFAASDFQFFFKEATGVTLEIVTEADDLKGKYFSIGETAIQKASGMKLDYDELGRDGYKVLTYGDAVVMAGTTDEASTYAVYGYLGKQFGLEIYGVETWEIGQTDKAKLVDLDWTDVPDIPMRNAGSSYVWYKSMANMSRMRCRNITDGWGLATHTYFLILPPSKYVAEHPDWYDDAQNPQEICMTSAGAKAQFIENMKQIILDSPNCIYYEIGHEDGTPTCNCENCQALCQQYGGSYSAISVLFTNDVVNALNEWAAATIPERTLEFVFMAYTTTEVPPVQYDSTTETYYPYNHDQKLMFADNLGVIYCPIGSHVSVPYLENPTCSAYFKGWTALTDNLYVWAYSCPFSNQLVPFDWFGAAAQNYRDYVDMGAQFVFDQGFMDGYVPNFHELRLYLSSKLMWDCTLDTDTLVQNFMRNYYGCGWESIYEFYQLWRLRLVELQDQGMYSYVASQMVQDWCQASLYPKSLLDQYEKLFDAALEANEAIKESDPELYETVRDNIRADRCMIRYLEMEIYSNYYDYDTFKEMIDEFSDISAIKNFLSFGEGTVEGLLAEWTDELNNK